MNGKLNKNIGFSLFPLALFFIFEPFINIIDILPDFIGFCIICLALINLADINDRIKEAFVGFRRAAIINFLRIPAIYLLDRYFVDSEQSVSLLMFTFVFAMLELIALIPAYKNFFMGLSGLGITCDGTFVNYSKKLKGRDVTEKTQTLTTWFLIVKYLMSALPEFTTLISNDSFEFIKLLRIVGIVVAAILGAIWLIFTCRYLSNIRKDITFIERLSEKYLKFSNSNSGFFDTRIIKIAIWIMMIASVFSVDLYSNYINLIPDAVFYFLTLLSAIIIKKYSRKWIPLLLSCTCGIGTSIASSASANSFYSKFYPKDVLTSVKAYDSFYTMLGLRIADTVVFMITVCIIVLLIWDVYKKHTDVPHHLNGKAIREQRAVFIKLTVLPAVFTLLTTVATVYYVGSQPFYYIGKWYVEYASIISVALSIVFAASICYFLNSIINSVESHCGIVTE